MGQTRPAGDRRRWWFLLAGALLVIAALFWAAQRVEPERAEVDTASERTPGEGAASGGADSVDPVRRFTEFAASMSGVQDEAPLESETIAEGLRTLAGALGSAGVDRPEVLDDLRVAAVHVVLNPASLEVAATVRTAFINAAAAMPASGGTTAQQAAEGIRPDTPLTSQPAAVRRFFKAAAGAFAEDAAGTADSHAAPVAGNPRLRVGLLSQRTPQSSPARCEPHSHRA